MTPTRRICRICGRPAKRDETMTYSRHTRSNYCADDIDACKARARRARKAVVA